MSAADDGRQVLADLAVLGDAARLRAEQRLVAGHFDAAFYAASYPQVAAAYDDLLAHFCETGWRDLLKPRADFDVWWYWANHLDPAVDDLNPLVHHALVGVHEGLSTRPVPAAERPARTGATLPTDRPVRRAFLVAGFDADGVVDEAALLLLRELARFGDVHYLCDAYLPESELAAVREVATAAWSVRHGAYDFGSYSMLARDLVGWDRLAAYDEVVLVNDSCYLVRPLDELFAEMDRRACDWWGLQATKGLASTRENPANSFSEPVPLDRVRADLLEGFEDDPVYDFHLGSYFLAFRRPVLDDARFRRLLDSVHAQPGKLRIILKYEIGLTHLLVGNGYVWDTYVPALYPFHPLFTEWAFTLLEQGFPLLKRYLLFQNHYDVPGLARWQERVLAIAPDAPVEVFEENLRRTSPADRLARSRAIERDADGTVRVPEVLTGRAFVKRDKKVAAREDVWVFAVDATTHTLPDNSRAILEQVRHDPGLTAVVLTRSRRLDLAGGSVVEVPLLSPEGRERLLEARTVLVDGWPRRTLGVPVPLDRHDVIGVRGGLMLERSGRALATPTHPGSAPRRTPQEQMAWLHDVPAPVLTGLLAASDVDQTAVVATHWPARYADAWRTGLPMHDLLVADAAALPADLADQERRLREELGGRRLLLFAPTLRRSGTARAPYDFSAAEVDRLAAWARASDAVLGVREPVGDLERPYSVSLGAISLDVSPVRYPSTPAVLRAADAVLTDYSGTALDFMATGRPVLAFAHDLANARGRLLVDPEHLFPGPVTRDVEGLLDALGSVFEPSAATRRHYDRVRDLLLDPPDGGAAARVVARIRELSATRRDR